MNPKASDERQRLSTTDWIDGGLAVLAEHGVQGMRVTDVAEALGVTKGSFYWHFRDRTEFLQKLAERWAGDRTTERLDAIAAATTDPFEQLRFLRGQARELEAADRAMRNWAGDDNNVAAAVAAADRRVHAFMMRCFRDLGFDSEDADLKARTLLYAFVGQYQVTLDEGTGPDASERLVAMLVESAHGQQNQRSV